MKLSLEGPWIARFRNGEEKAVEHFFGHHFPSLRQFAKKIVKENNVAEEIAMDSFTKAWHLRHTFNTDDILRGFLYVTTRHACLNQLRKKNLEEKLSPEEVDNYSETVDADEIEKQEKKAKTLQFIYEEIEKLTGKGKQVFEMHYLEGYKIKDIAENLHLSENTVYTHLKRARQKLSKQADKKGISPFYLYWFISSAALMTVRVS